MRARSIVVLAAGVLSCRAASKARPSIGAAGGGTRVTVEVLNASGQPGLARLGTLGLRDEGLDVVGFGTADTSMDSTTVLVRRGNRSAGDRVAAALGTARVRMAADSLPRVDVTVLLGRDWKPKANGRP